MMILIHESGCQVFIDIKKFDNIQISECRYSGIPVFHPRNDTNDSFFVKQLAVLNLLGRCSPKCDYNKTSMEIQKNDIKSAKHHWSTFFLLVLSFCPLSNSFSVDLSALYFNFPQTWPLLILILLLITSIIHYSGCIEATYIFPYWNHICRKCCYSHWHWSSFFCCIVNGKMEGQFTLLVFCRWTIYEETHWAFATFLDGRSPWCTIKCLATLDRKWMWVTWLKWYNIELILKLYSSAKTSI